MSNSLNEDLSHSSENLGLSDDDSKDKKIEKINYDKFISSVVKIHTSIILSVFSLMFSRHQTNKNKHISDEEISEHDIILGIVYIITLIFSFIRGVNSYYTLSHDYEVSKSDKIFKENFMKSN